MRVEQVQKYMDRAEVANTLGEDAALLANEISDILRPGQISTLEELRTAAVTLRAERDAWKAALDAARRELQRTLAESDSFRTTMLAMREQRDRYADALDEARVERDTLAAALAKSEAERDAARASLTRMIGWPPSGNR
jgi:chromosome segregation ATPase